LAEQRMGVLQTMQTTLLISFHVHQEFSGC
jgi:hypothetical protein